MLSDMYFRLGGDPRALVPFNTLRDELARLNHPACPDVDWAKVEQCCRQLFESNGLELQSVAAYALARSQRYGLAGVVEGVSLLETLLASEWSRLWPPAIPARLDILSWLFAQLQPLLRGFELTTRDLADLVALDTVLERMSEQLDRQALAPVVVLLSLRQQVDSLVQRLTRRSTLPGVIVPPTRLAPEPSVAWPDARHRVCEPLPAVRLSIRVDNLPPETTPPAKSKRRVVAMWLLAGLGLIAGGWWGWHYWLTQGDGMHPYAAVFASANGASDSVRMDSLSLFKAGSAELKPGSSTLLINALVDIKAQPGWLIVIAGHTDTTGNAEHNLQLSRERAAAVRNWMQSRGDFPDSCFAVQGFGASQPVADNQTQAGRAANRRVDISLVQVPGACA
ncbi:OmpA family protein [Pseudomonas sp. BBP2017]|uniref:OmpA family protein n=1 Tax=Pseudomonas sp. BBP2017 TaxID=2109731 RepID=UPI0026CB29A5